MHPLEYFLSLEIMLTTLCEQTEVAFMPLLLS